MSVDAKKHYVIGELRKNGCRVTSQRQLLLDIILRDDWGSCKEIYYHANQLDPEIGLATVYRFIKALEDTGLIHRKNMYRIDGKPAVAQLKTEGA